MRGSADVLYLVSNRTFDSVSQDVFAREEQLGTAAVVIKRPVTCQLLLIIFRSFHNEIMYLLKLKAQS